MSRFIVWTYSTIFLSYGFENKKTSQLCWRSRKDSTFRAGKKECIYPSKYHLSWQSLEIKRVICEIKCDKLWKSKVLFEKSNAINFGNQKCHLKNQRRLILEIESVNWEIKTRLILEIKSVIWEIKTRLILEIKSVIWEIKRDKFGNQKCHLRNQNASNFGNQKCHLRNQTRQILEIKCHLRNQNLSNFGNQKCHLRNQMRQILEIKRVIWKIKGD